MRLKRFETRSLVLLLVTGAWIGVTSTVMNGAPPQQAPRPIGVSGADIQRACRAHHVREVRELPSPW